MDHAEFNSTMVPPSSPGLGLGSTPNPVLSQENFPTLQQTSSKNKRQRPDSDDETEASTTFKSFRYITGFNLLFYIFLFGFKSDCSWANPGAYRPALIRLLRVVRGVIKLRVGTSNKC